MELFAQFNLGEDQIEYNDFEQQLMVAKHQNTAQKYEQFGLTPPEEQDYGVSEGVFIW